MALATLVSGLKVKRRALQYAGVDSATGQSSNVANQIRTFFENLAQLENNPDLVLLPFGELSDTESGNSIFSDSACKLYAIYLRKDTATASFSKFADSATISIDASANDFAVRLSRIGDFFVTFPGGSAMANGLVAQGNTTANGGTSSASDGAKGWVILNAA